MKAKKLFPDLSIKRLWNKLKGIEDKVNEQSQNLDNKFSWKFISGGNGGNPISLAYYEHISSEFMFVVSYNNSDFNTLEIMPIIVPHNEIFNIDRDVKFFGGGAYGGTLGIGASIMINKNEKTADIFDLYFNGSKSASEGWVNVYYR